MPRSTFGKTRLTSCCLDVHYTRSSHWTITILFSGAVVTYYYIVVTFPGYCTYTTVRPKPRFRIDWASVLSWSVLSKSQSQRINRSDQDLKISRSAQAKQPEIIQAHVCGLSAQKNYFPTTFWKIKDFVQGRARWKRLKMGKAWETLKFRCVSYANRRAPIWVRYNFLQGLMLYEL